jgi:uncharacterized protein (TIGR02231 family)
MINTRLALAITLCFALPEYACADNAPISRVTVYPGSATVERTSAVKAGMTELEINGLPANFDTETVRVQASAGIQVGQIVTRDAGSASAPSPREADLEGKIRALKDEKDVLNVEAKSAALVQNYLEHLNGGGERNQAVNDGKAMAGMIDAIRRGGREAFSQIQRTQVQVREIDQKIAALQRDLDRARSGARDQRSITITLAAAQAGTIKLSYQVNGAGWKPSYRAMLNTNTSHIDLERMAIVSQKTGEDWSGVELSLSTGQPRLSPQAPDPQPRLVTYYKPVPVQADAVAYSRAMVAPAPSAPIMERTLMKSAAGEPYIPPVLETQGTFDTTFAVPNRVNLASDGREISLSLSHLDLPSTQRVRVVPRQDTAAVVTAEASRPAGVWLNGDIQLLRDGNLVGHTYWNTQGTENLTLPFGRDELVRVSVDRSNQQASSKGLLSQREEHVVADVYTISSFHKKPVELLVLESSPVSTSDEVKVQSTFAPQPGITQWQQRQGIVGWEKTLAPNESTKITVRYAITYPKEGTVNGLP